MNCALIHERPVDGGAKNAASARLYGVPSFTMQTDWPAQYFRFDGCDLRPTVEGGKHGDFHNPSLCARDDGDWLLVRRSVWKQGYLWGVNDIVAFKLNRVMPTGGTPLKMIARVPEEHYEDPRVFVHEGRTFLSCCNFVWNHPQSRPHQIFCEMDKDWNCIRRFDPDFDGNGSHPFKGTQWQKNWLWFFHEGHIHLIYRTHIHHVVRFESNLKNVIKEYKTRHPKLAWKWGEMRGGSPPVRIGDEFWSFFHSSTDWGTKRYHMGAYCFEAKPPFMMTRCSDSPLLSGSEQDRIGNGKPLVIFAGGAVLRRGEWLVVFGVNDLDCGWIRIPHADLEKRMVTL